MFVFEQGSSFCVLLSKLLDTDTLYMMDLMSFATNDAPRPFYTEHSNGFLSYRNVSDTSCDVRLHVTALHLFQGSHPWKPSAVVDTKRLLISNSVLISAVRERICCAFTFEAGHDVGLQAGCAHSTELV